MTTETHPLQPFLPAAGRMLFLGSFPPPRARWSMDFFYPNWINDFWRIQGLIHFGDKTHFEVPGEKRFDRERIVAFAESVGLAFYDTARVVRRLKGNASDNFLEVVETADIGSLVAAMPLCDTVVTTGGKASELLRRQLSAAAGMAEGELVAMPEVGGRVEVCRGVSSGQNNVGTNGFFAHHDRIVWWRMPSSSRAYPLALAKKAECYRRLF